MISFGDDFDSLAFVNWKDKYIKIPPFFKSFRPYLFYWSKTQMIVIQSVVTCVFKKAFYFSRIKKKLNSNKIHNFNK